MKDPKKSVSQGNLRSLLVTLCIGITIMLLASAPGYGQGPGSDVALDDFDKAAVWRLRCIADAAAQTLNLYMNDRVTDMLVWSEIGGALRDALTAPKAREDANRALEKCFKLSGMYEAILLLDKRGACVASAPEGLVSKNFADNEAFKGAANGKLTLVDFHKSDILTSLDPNSKGWTVTIAVPVKVENDVAGVLMSLLKWSELVELMGVMVPKTSIVFVLDKQNQAIIYPGKNAMYGSRDPFHELDDSITRRRPYYAYVFRHLYNDRPRKILVGLVYPKGYGNFPGLGWTVGAKMDQTETVTILKMLLRRFFFR